MPTTRAIAGSSTAARIIAPRRVRSSSAHSATAMMEAITMITSRYNGKAAPNTVVVPCAAGGVSTEIGSPPHSIRQTSATMNDRPSVTRTWASSAPTRRRSTKRSMMPPNKATPRPASRAAVQKPKPQAMRLTPKYAPSMNIEPWVRFGMRISPKIKVKPADSRNSSPPSVTLLTERISQRFTGRAAGASGFQRRVVPRIDRLGEEPLLVIGPELAHVGIGLDRELGQFAVLLHQAADVDIPHHITEMIEVERPARRVAQRHRAQRLDQCFLVVRLAAGRFQGR